LRTRPTPGQPSATTTRRTSLRHSRRRPRRKERTALVCELPFPLCGYILPLFPPDRGISHPHKPL
jgi:hypothetical protein